MKMFMILVSFFMILGRILCSSEEENKDTNEFNGIPTNNCSEKYNAFWFNRHFNESSPTYMKAGIRCKKLMKDQPLEREKVLKLGNAFHPLLESENTWKAKCYLLNDQVTMNTALSTIKKYCGNKSGDVMAHHLNRARKCFQCDLAPQTTIFYQ
ncbi:hypothetical protein CRE_08405 [Caenorhabditis remanei]|uniref:Uncharacterized protein n=2 Tax=Caenorhabditis remanei TaxID=31234 RepID=E3MPK2_CAERE|nr:hypothetical protein CRE_08405 [Caenorhabditis remanei]